MQKRTALTLNGIIALGMAFVFGFVHLAQAQSGDGYGEPENSSPSENKEAPPPALFGADAQGGDSLYVPRSSEEEIVPIGPNGRVVPDVGWGSMAGNKDIKAGMPVEVSTDHVKGRLWHGGVITSIWNDNYKLGLGLHLGGRTAFVSGTELGGDVIYSWFRRQDDLPEFPSAVHESGLRFFLVHPLTVGTQFILKLGAQLGASRLYEGDWGIIVGGEAHGAIPIADPYGIQIQFSPGYVIGKGQNERAIFRVGLGLTRVF